MVINSYYTPKVEAELAIMIVNLRQVDCKKATYFKKASVLLAFPHNWPVLCFLPGTVVVFDL